MYFILCVCGNLLTCEALGSESHKDNMEVYGNHRQLQIVIISANSDHFFCFHRWTDTCKKTCTDAMLQQLPVEKVIDGLPALNFEYVPNHLRYTQTDFQSTLECDFFFFF